MIYKYLFFLMLFTIASCSTYLPAERATASVKCDQKSFNYHQYLEDNSDCR